MSINFLMKKMPHPPGSRSVIGVWGSGSGRSSGSKAGLSSMIVIVNPSVARLADHVDHAIVAVHTVAMFNDVGAGFVDRQIAVMDSAFVESSGARLFDDEIAGDRHIFKNARNPQLTFPRRS